MRPAGIPILSAINIPDALFSLIMINSHLLVKLLCASI